MPRRAAPWLFAAALAASAGAARSQESPAAARVPPDAATMKLSFAPIVRRAAPAVVNVYSRRVVRQQVDPFWAMFSGGGVSRDRIEQSQGSGSIVRADGVVLTNHHNIEGAQEIRVVTADRREWPATVLLDDPRADLAVLRIDPKGESLPTLRIDEAAAPQVGDLVLAIGDPFGVGQTVTNGIVSALARSQEGEGDMASFIQTDASINPGNSGGPLVDMAGDMIGVNTAIVSSSGASAGVGFAIPAAMARQVVNAALGGGHAVVRPWLGAKTQALTDEMARSLGLASPRGVLVTDVWPDGAAARAGLQRGDVILAAAGEAVDDPTGLDYRVGTGRIGETLALATRRGGAARTVVLPLRPPSATPLADPRLIGGHNPLAGSSVVNLSPATAYDYGVDPFVASGVLVTRVGPGFGASIGLRAGDMIRAVNGARIATTADLSAAVRTDAGHWVLSIERDGRVITVRLGG